MNGHEYLKLILHNYQLTDAMEDKLKGKRKLIENYLKSVFGNDISYIRYSGSHSKETAVSLDYDLDLCVFFHRNSFKTLHEMYDSVFHELSKNFRTRRQRVSIGIQLGDFDIDVVPARLIENGVTGDANLYDYESDGYIKTNITKQVEYVSKSHCRPIIKLMKIWKIRNDVPVKSFALELLTIDALRNYRGNNYHEQFDIVLGYIVINIGHVDLIDPGNSNNNLSDTINSESERRIRGCAVQSLNARLLKEVIW